MNLLKNYTYFSTIFSGEILLYNVLFLEPTSKPLLIAGNLISLVQSAEVETLPRLTLLGFFLAFSFSSSNTRL